MMISSLTDLFSTRCSTPFGIYEVGTSSGGVRLMTIIGCSTPFGIYEVGTQGCERS